MSVPSYDEAMKTSREGSPFSNGTEGYAWLENWCGRCINDKPAREGDEANGCPLVLVALLGRTPVEWVDQWDGKSPFPLGDNYHCILFRDEDDGPDPEPKPIPDPPGQLTLAPREPYEAARMLTTYPTRTEVLV